MSALQSSLREVYRHAGTERILYLVTVLGEKATLVAANNASDTESVMVLRRVLADFEQAVRTYLASTTKG